MTDKEVLQSIEGPCDPEKEYLILERASILIADGEMQRKAIMTAIEEYDNEQRD